jgi:hypothetical protein
MCNKAVAACKNAVPDGVENAAGHEDDDDDDDDDDDADDETCG